MTMHVPILVVDDEPPIRRLLRTSLTPQGFFVLEAATGRDALHLLAVEKPAIVLLDLGLPDMDGLDVIRRIREEGAKLPIVVLSSRGDERGKVEALDLGADDYVTKPFSMAELLARLRSALRRRVVEQGGEPVFRFGDLEADLPRRRIVRDGHEVKLSPKEYAIFHLLALNAGKVLTHRAIMHEIWGAEGDVQYLRIYIRQLRQKLERDPDRPALILTETGVGYRLQDAG